jgi:NhaP-type Na+/H+ or K+/H+ antiporter
MRPSEYVVFMRHYFPVFIGCLSAGLCAVASLVLLHVDTFYQELTLEDGVHWLFGGAVVGVVGLFACHFFLIRGRIRAVWGMELFFFLCLFLSLPIIEHSPGELMFFVGVLAPVVGLLMLNSRRHRQMREIFFFMRRKRERFRSIRRVRLRRLRDERSN